MKFFPIAIMISLLGANTSYAQDLTITTGGPSGTYYQFGKDIALMAKSSGMNIDVANSQGSVENLERILGYQGAEEGKFFQIGIVQEDVLTALRRHAKGNKILEEIVGKVKVVMPLYKEELHIFVKKNSEVEGQILESFNQIEGADATIGKRLSGTFVTYHLLSELAGINSKEVFSNPVSASDGLQDLKNFDTQAVFYVAGAPAKLAKDAITSENGITLLTVDNPSIFSNEDNPYIPVTIGPDQYSWMSETVATIAVPSLLVTYEYSAGENCDNIELLTRVIIKNLDNLRRNRHEKWAQVDPREAIARNDISSCAQKALDEF